MNNSCVSIQSFFLQTEIEVEMKH